ncbi:VanZ family protein [Vagococcus sp. CY53-2]|uniref:VanZ family protein n=1 Tax=Vagococcus sp. CY53-2 TaxID=2925780 RepID=UPI00240D27FA|nr:VanZ family protein [Vagococcus sp. CY53-2]
MIILLFSLVIEVLQFIFGLGATDMTGVITNTLGGIAGFLIYQLLKLGFKENTLGRVLFLLV